MTKMDSKLIIAEIMNGYKIDKSDNIDVINEISANHAKDLFKNIVFEASSTWFKENNVGGAEVWGNEVPPESAEQPPEAMDEKESGDEFDFSFLDHGLKEDDMSTAYPSGLNGQDISYDFGIDASHIIGQDDDTGTEYSGSVPLNITNIGNTG